MSVMAGTDEEARHSHRHEQPSCCRSLASWSLMLPGAVGKSRSSRCEGAARVLLLAEAAERHAELQEIVGGLAALGIFLIAEGEGGGGVLVFLAHVIGLAEPVLRVAGERVVGIVLDEGS